MRRLAMILAIGLWSVAHPAFADAIDGDWCHKDGRSFHIQGPEITTPGGTDMRGNYDRHGFFYVVPAAEPDAGAEVVMILRDHYTLDLKLQGADGKHEIRREIWRRCEAKTS